MPIGTDIMTHSAVILRPDASRTVIRPFDLADPEAFADQKESRPERIADRIKSLQADALRTELGRVMASLRDRHHDADDTVLRRFAEIKDIVDCASVDRDRAMLIGAYFSEEYAFESAALFNPSIVAHPDQDGVPAGGIRFIMSLRGIGEGHLSSVTFRTGLWDPAGGFAVDDPSPIAVGPQIERDDDFDDGVIHVNCGASRDISESILFPVTKSQARGIEDLRLCRFVDDDDRVSYLGTYTAFSGSTARSELLEADSFRSMTLRKMTGDAAAGKGMALFPRRIDGRYAMLGRQDSENLRLIYSDELTHWEGGEVILAPKYFWEFIQIGNCGSPIEIDEGWLVLTHGVGSVRNYCIGAALLDKRNPAKVLGRMTLPLVHPSPKERDGYVPNVVYSCGSLVHDRILLLPYGVADTFTTFAHVALDDLLAVLK
ncbi:MAG: glycoside hydrolase family 130 protein [Pseudomonadota bacterium]|nr:glycoside hydrolase family 130 protein [Pseudomonadota bacterium]